jgi:8-oxo-dGTP pyrophosphatase MutT (NUDIX family)
MHTRWAKGKSLHTSAHIASWVEHEGLCEHAPMTQKSISQVAASPATEPTTEPANITRFAPSVTVAGIIERAGRYLLVEEHTVEGLKLNNPAGHLEQGESPFEAVCREVFEETACHFEPTHFLGVYLARFVRQTPQAETQDITYLRLAYAGRVGPQDASCALDQGIVRTLWMTRDEVAQNLPRLRSPLVLRCIDDHAAGVRWPLGAVQDDGSLRVPTVK